MGLQIQYGKGINFGDLWHTSRTLLRRPRDETNHLTKELWITARINFFIVSFTRCPECDRLGRQMRSPIRLGKSKPSHYLVMALDDKMIPFPAQRAMAGRAKAQIVEVLGSHDVYVS